jgi:hypothetical protein
LIAAATYDKTRRRHRIPAAAAAEYLPPQNTCRRRGPKTRRRCSNPAAAALKPAAATVTLPLPPKTLNFLRLWLYGYKDHDNLDHGYIMIGDLDINIKNTAYSNSRTPFNSVRIVTCVHTPLPL